MHDSRELIETALAGEKPRRTPIFDLLANDAVVEHFAGNALDGTDDETTVVTAAARGLDATRAVATPNQQRTVWTDPAGNRRVSDRWTSWREKPAFPDLDGWAEWMSAYVEQGSNGREGSIHLDLTAPKFDERQGRLEAERQRAYNERLGGTVNIHCTPSTAVNALLYYVGLETFSFLWADRRELLKRWIAVYREKTLNYISATAHAVTSPLAMIYCDVAYNHGPMFSVAMFDEMGFFEEVEVLCDAIHDRRMAAVFHSDGNITDLLDDLAATGIDGLNPIEKAAGMDVLEVRRRFPELVLVGGVDVTHLLRTASPREIRRETRRIVEEAGARGRLLIGSSTEVGDDVPLENYVAFHDEVMQGN